MFVTTGSPAVSLALHLHGHKCMQARIHDDATVTLSRARPSFHSCKYTHFFLKETHKKALDYSGTMGEGRSPRQQAESD